MIENEVNEDEIDYERHDMKKVWSNIENPFSEKEIDQYLKNARLFWNYRNIGLEQELFSIYFNELKTYLKENKELFIKKAKIVQEKIDDLKYYLNQGIHLNNHFDEMALKILYICKFKQKVALIFIYKGFNPFIEGKIKIKFRD